MRLGASPAGTFSIQGSGLTSIGVLGASGGGTLFEDNRLGLFGVGVTFAALDSIGRPAPTVSITHSLAAGNVMSVSWFPGASGLLGVSDSLPNPYVPAPLGSTPFAPVLPISTRPGGGFDFEHSPPVVRRDTTIPTSQSDTIFPLPAPASFCLSKWHLSMATGYSIYSYLIHRACL